MVRIWISWLALLLSGSTLARPLASKARLTILDVDLVAAASSPQSSPPSPLSSALRKSFRQGLQGGFAGFVQVITTMWLRTTVTYQYAYGVTLQQALTELYSQGGVARFYRGVTYAIVQAPLCRFGSVAANEISNIIIGVPATSSHRDGSKVGKSKGTSKDNSDNRNVYMKIVIASMLGSALSTLFRVFLMPLDTCKTVLQVDGPDGFGRLMRRVTSGDVAPLFRGATATIVATWIGHSWFLVHNWLDKLIAVPVSANARVMRAAWIGFLASAFSDAVSNVVKVVKTVKQALAAGDHSSVSYLEVVKIIVAESGYVGLFGRGLSTRIVSNGVQSMLFTVLWKVVALDRRDRGTSPENKPDRKLK